MGEVNSRDEPLDPHGTKPLIDWMAHYSAFWTEHADRLEQLLQKIDE
jgi:hypothetical protein